MFVLSFNNSFVKHQMSDLHLKSFWSQQMKEFND